MSNIIYNGCLSKDTAQDCQELMESYSYCVEIAYLPNNLDNILQKRQWYSEAMGVMNTILYATTKKDIHNKNSEYFLFLKDKTDYDAFITHYKDSNIIINTQPFQINFDNKRKIKP